MTTSLSTRELDELHMQLQRREGELLRELKSGKQRAAAERFEQLAGEVPDAGDASVADLAIDSATAERVRDSDELRDVQEALTRMESGMFGLCLECGRPIAAERLRAMPFARYDLEHQRDREEPVRAPTL